ncbi:MAG: tyrosine-type recombinase/integrase, partial [Pseudomonadota bacterium]
MASWWPYARVTFDANAGAVTIHTSKGGRPRHVWLGEDGAEFFANATAGRAADALIFSRADGDPWAKSHQCRPMREASRRAKITPAVSFHILRHTYGSMLAQRGVVLQVIAQNMGHADTRMTERHYAHLSASHVADVFARRCPRLNLPSSGNVRSISA